MFNSSLEEEVAELIKFYTVSRYPDAAAGQPYEVVTRSDAQRSLETAEEVLFLEQFLRSAGYEGNPRRSYKLLKGFYLCWRKAGLELRPLTYSARMQEAIGYTPAT
ncbi:MAG: HEPN domain-containing protein [Pyrobaculum sp.]